MDGTAPLLSTALACTGPTAPVADDGRGRPGRTGRVRPCPAEGTCGRDDRAAGVAAARSRPGRPGKGGREVKGRGRAVRGCTAARTREPAVETL